MSGNCGLESVTVDGNKVYLTLGDNLGSTEEPTVSIQSGVIKDKAGNAWAADGMRPYDGAGSEPDPVQERRPQQRGRSGSPSRLMSSSTLTLTCG